jgi:hypothetical protein
MKMGNGKPIIKWVKKGGLAKGYAPGLGWGLGFQGPVSLEKVDAWIEKIQKAGIKSIVWFFRR